MEKHTDKTSLDPSKGCIDREYIFNQAIHANECFVLFSAAIAADWSPDRSKVIALGLNCVCAK